MLTSAGIVMHSNFDDDNFPQFDLKTIKHMSGEEKTGFIEYVEDDYYHCLKMKQHPDLIKYYKDVLARLIKTYGH